MSTRCSRREVIPSSSLSRTASYSRRPRRVRQSEHDNQRECAVVSIASARRPTPAGNACERTELARPPCIHSHRTAAAAAAAAAIALILLERTRAAAAAGPEDAALLLGNASCRSCVARASKTQCAAPTICPPNERTGRRPIMRSTPGGRRPRQSDDDEGGTISIDFCGSGGGD